MFRLVPSHNMLHTRCQLQAHTGMILEVLTEHLSLAAIWLLILKLYPVFHWPTSDCYLYLCQIRTLSAASTGGITHSWTFLLVNSTDYCSIWCYHFNSITFSRNYVFTDNCFAWHIFCQRFILSIVYRKATNLGFFLYLIRACAITG